MHWFTMCRSCADLQMRAADFHLLRWTHFEFIFSRPFVQLVFAVEKFKSIQFQINEKERTQMQTQKEKSFEELQVSR